VKIHLTKNNTNKGVNQVKRGLRAQIKTKSFKAGNFNGFFSEVVGV